MRVHHHLPAKFEARIEAFSFEMLAVFFPILVIIFMAWHPVVEALFVIAFYYTTTLLPMVFKKGQSLGKLSVKTRIVNLNNEPVSLKKAHGRELFKWVCGFLTLGVYFVIAFIVFTQRQDNRALHDLLFKTKVIYTEPKVSGM